MASDEGDDPQKWKEVSLVGIEVQQDLIEESFRDGCQQGNVDVLHQIIGGCNQQEKHKLLTNCSACTGTPLFDAIISQQVEVVKYLLELGCDLEMECEVNIFYPIFFRDKCTALCLACACGDVEIGRLLLENGASINHTSSHSSPLIYASEYNDVALMSMLLEHGADVNVVPRSLKTEVAVLPLYQACLLGHKDTAELLMYSSNVDLHTDKKVCLLALLGAQCINKTQDYACGLKFWKLALLELEKLKSSEAGAASALPVPSGGEDLAAKLHKLYVTEAAKAGTNPTELSTSTILMGEVGQRSSYSIFKDVKLCTTAEELDKLASDESALNFQGLLVLESILGPSHTETTQQVSHAARLAFESGDLIGACRLFLYIIESNERRNQSQTAAEYMAQLVDLLFKIYSTVPEQVFQMPKLPDLLLAALDLIQEGAAKTYNMLASTSSEANPTLSYFEPQAKKYSKVRMLSGMVENFMAFSRLLIDQKLEQRHQEGLRQILAKFLKLRLHKAAVKYNIEPELFKIAVYGGCSAVDTLNYFQEEFFPDVRILHLLLECGADVNCQDNLCGDTPLHLSIDCRQPKKEIIETLLSHNAHIDICNRYGVTPYALFLRSGHLGINAFQYMSLKCLAAQTIALLGIHYKGQVPKSLDDFIAWHGLEKFSRCNMRLGTSTAHVDRICLSSLQ